MRLGLSLIETTFSAHPSIDIERVRFAEELGYDSVWTAEGYGCDAVTTATWVAAHTSKIKVGTSIMQIPARSPASAAMTAIGLDALSQQRFILGLGSSGPQVVEGWHGLPYDRPLTRSREYVEIVRRILKREEPVTFEGYHYQLPFTGPGAKGLGKPLRSVAHGNPDIPIYLASISPGGLRCAAEIADGVILSFLKPEDAQSSVGSYLAEGFAKEGARCQRQDFTIANSVYVIMGDDTAGLRDAMRPEMARSLGGMGAKSKNFYAEYASRIGYADAVSEIQELYLQGRKLEASDAVPDQLLDDLHLIGPADRIRERLADWKDCERRGGVDLLLVNGAQADALRLMAEELL